MDVWTDGGGEGILRDVLYDILYASVSASRYNVRYRYNACRVESLSFPHLRVTEEAGAGLKATRCMFSMNMNMNNINHHRYPCKPRSSSIHPARYHDCPFHSHLNIRFHIPIASLRSCVRVQALSCFVSDSVLILPLTLVMCAENVSSIALHSSGNLNVVDSRAGPGIRNLMREGWCAAD